MRLTAITAALLITTSCSSFYEDHTSYSVATHGFEVRTFDDSLPDAMESIFEACSEPLVLSEGQDDLTLLGDCNTSGPDNLNPAETDLVRILEIQSVEMDQPLTLSSQGEPSLHSFGLWGIQCSVTITPSVTVDSIALYDLQAWWTTRHGKAALRVDFDFDDGIQADLTFDRSPVVCSRSWANRYARAALDVVLDETYSVEFTNPDLDLWVKLSRGVQNYVPVNGYGSPLAPFALGVLDVRVEAQMRIGEIQTGTVLDALPGGLKSSVLANSGFRAWRHENNIEDGIEAALEGLEVQLEDRADNNLGSICSVQTLGGELVIQHDDDCVSNAVAPRTWVLRR